LRFQQGHFVNGFHFFASMISRSSICDILRPSAFASPARMDLAWSLRTKLWRFFLGIKVWGHKPPFG
jgi:hypothetical protein